MTARRPEWGKTMFDDDRITVVGIQSRVDLALTSTHTLGVAVQGSSEGVDARRKEVRDENITFYQRGRFPGGTVGESFSAAIENHWTPSPESSNLPTWTSSASPSRPDSGCVSTSTPTSWTRCRRSIR